MSHAHIDLIKLYIGSNDKKRFGKPTNIKSFTLTNGVKEFVSWLQAENKKFVFLTNSSERTIKELQGKLSRMGLDVGPEHFYTSALATASFLQSQRPNGSAYIIGEAGLINALYNAGYTSNNIRNNFV